MPVPHSCIDTIPLIGDHVAFAKLSFAMPDAPGSEIGVPVKFKVWSDDLPEGAEDRVKQVEFRPRKKGR